jgi:hypothetical protein
MEDVSMLLSGRKLQLKKPFWELQCRTPQAVGHLYLLGEVGTVKWYLSAERHFASSIAGKSACQFWSSLILAMMGLCRVTGEIIIAILTTFCQVRYLRMLLGRSKAN